MIAPGGMRIPPGRAGRLWLERRLATAQHAGKLLTQKLAILNREEQRLVQRAEEGTGQWRRLCTESETWTLRAAVLSSRRALRLASDGTTAQAEIAMGFTIGIEHPVGGVVHRKQQDLPVVGSAAVSPGSGGRPRCGRGRPFGRGGDRGPEDGAGGAGSHSPNPPSCGAAVDT